jgi:hypothetical protein
LKEISSWLASFFSRPNAAHTHRTSKALALEKNVNLFASPSGKLLTMHRIALKRTFWHDATENTPSWYINGTIIKPRPMKAFKLLTSLSGQRT